MLHYVVVFFVGALVAALLGFGDVRNVHGVGRVTDKRHGVSNAQQDAAQSQDDEIEHEMTRVFQTHANFKAIGIDVTNCFTRLTGAVSSESERREAVQVAIERLAAMQVARATAAACFVEDDLYLTH